MSEPRLLLVEDEPVTRMMLDAHLRATGLRVTSVASAEQALELLGEQQFAVMITDLLLERLDGVGLLRAARAIDPDLEVIVLTGQATLDSAIAAVNHGAHSYLRKPARRGELEDRVAAALARRQAHTERRAALRQLGAQLMRLAEPAGPGYTREAEASCLRVGRLELDTHQRRAAVDRRPVPLSSGEFDLLHYLACHARRVLSAEQIAREALAFGACTPAEARELVKVRVHRLRSKIEGDPHAPTLLVSVRGAGYMLTGGEHSAAP